jgi:hypothetical protein
MALLKCRECGSKISSQAKSCPICGLPNPTGKISGKAKIGLVLVGVFIVALAMNGSGENSRRNVNVVPAPSEIVDERVPHSTEAGIPIPKTMAGDKGSYFLLESKRNGEVTETLHKRIGPDGVTGFTRTEIDCRTMKFRELGYSETSPADIQTRPLNWAELVPGSSKSDLVNFVCKKG